MGREPIAWRGDRGQSPWDTATLRPWQAFQAASPSPEMQTFAQVWW
jgi:hypothetical protein